MDQFDSFKILFAIYSRLQGEEGGVSTIELAQEFGISRQTAHKYMRHLQSILPITYDERRYVLDRGYRAPKHLSLPEAEVLDMLIRRLARTKIATRADVALVLQQLSAKLPVGRYQAIAPTTPTAQPIFPTLVQAKSERREVILLYRAPRALRATQWTLRPYLFEMPVWSDSFYVIGDGTMGRGSYRRLTLKVDRIIAAELTRMNFDPPPLDKVQHDARLAWGIWQSDQAPQRVVLRFSFVLHERLRESLWHPSVELSQEGGTIVWQALIAEPQEMIPWIRSWGADVEVVAPEELRQQIMDDLARGLARYQALPTVPSNSDLQELLWAKYHQGAVHPVIHHLIDVAAVAWVMWETFGEAQRTWLSHLLQMDEAEARRLCAFLVGLHDLGKVSPAFQGKIDLLREALSRAGLPFPKLAQAAHGAISAYLFAELLPGLLQANPFTCRILGSAIGGHHGRWISYEESDSCALAVGGEAWRPHQQRSLDALTALFRPPALPELDDASLYLLASFLAGYTSVADWIGSNEQFFGYEPRIGDLHLYLERSVSKARHALTETGWFGWDKRAERLPFEELFPFPPNAMQHVVIQAVHEQAAPPHLILIEAGTGEGKTEAALYLADQLLNWRGLNGLYIAMPTQAISNQMFSRTAEFLARRYPDELINYQLIHGQAEYHPLMRELISTVEGQPSEEGSSPLTAQAWFSSRKRALLSPFAVGTVDQGLMAILPTPHFFVRLFALSHKVIILDEVHAYDTYMGRLLDRLLDWLYGLGAAVILLSATLPREARQRLTGHHALPDVRYPRATLVSADGLKVVELPRQQQRTIALEKLGAQDDLAQRVADRLREGGCACLLCNTVAEAQAIFREMESSGLFTPDELILFHAQFPMPWREAIEQSVLERFGKNGAAQGQRPHRALLVATQIVEQSLDLDFDWLISSTAPIDLLIQRVGRLHRHAHNTRPARLQRPTLSLRQPELHEGIPQFGKSEYVYERYLLLRTWLVLRDQAQIRLPDEVDALIEAVYSDATLDTDDALARSLEEAHKQMKRDSRRDSYKAATNRIASWKDDSLFQLGPEVSEEDDVSLRTQTRLIEPSVRIVCLFAFDQGDGQLSWSLDPQQFIPCPLDAVPDQDGIHHILRHALHVRHAKLRQVLAMHYPVVETWQRAAALRDLHVIHLGEEDTLIIEEEQLALRLSKRYGLEILS